MCPAERDPVDIFRSKLDIYHLPDWKADHEPCRKVIKNLRHIFDFRFTNFLSNSLCFEAWACSPTGSLCHSVCDILKKNAGRWRIQNRTERRRHRPPPARWSCSGHHEPQLVCVRLREKIWFEGLTAAKCRLWMIRSEVMNLFLSTQSEQSNYTVCMFRHTHTHAHTPCLWRSEWRYASAWDKERHNLSDDVQSTEFSCKNVQREPWNQERKVGIYVQKQEKM